MPPRRARAAKGSVKTTEKVTTDTNAGVITIEEDGNESMETEPNQNDSVIHEDDTTETEAKSETAAKTETADTSTASKDDVIEVTPKVDEQVSTQKGDNLFENLSKDADTDSSPKEVKEGQTKKTVKTDTPKKKTDSTETPKKKTESTETPIKKTDSTETSVKKTGSTETPKKKTDSTETPTKKTDSTEASVKKADNTETTIKKTDNTETPKKKTGSTETPKKKTDTTETHKTEEATEVKSDSDVIEKLDTDSEKEEDASKGAIEVDETEDTEEIDEEANQEMDTTTSSKEENADKTEVSETSGGEDKQVEDKNELNITVEDKEKKELEDEIPYPETMKKLKQLTVNIGPIKLNDLKSSDLHSVLSLTSDFEIKFEKKEDEDEEKEKKKLRPDSLGYVRIPLKIKSPSFFILIHKKLSSLRIDGRDMSVKFPEQLNIALNDAKKYVEALNLRAVRRQSEKAEEKTRGVRLQNLPHSITIEALKKQFPEALKIELTKIYRGELGGYIVLKSREKAKEWLKAHKEVKVEDKKVTTKLVVEDDRLQRPRAPKHKGGGPGASRGPRGRGMRGGRGSGRGTGRGQFGLRFGSGVAKNPVKERMEKFRNRQEQVRGRGGRGAAAGRGRGARQSEGPVVKMMGDLMKLQAQALARSASQTSPGSGPLLPSPTRAAPKGRRGMGSKRGNRERLMDQSPNRSSQTQFRSGAMTQGNQQRQSPGSGSGRFGRQDTGGFDRNRRFDTSDYEPERPAPARKASASVPSEDDPTAMMAYLKSTLARMEEKISQKSHTSSYQDEGPRDKYRGDKRKMDLDDYGRESTKRGTGYGYSEYESQDNYGSQSQSQSQSYSQRDDYGGSSGYGGKSRYGQMDSFATGYGSTTDSSDRLGATRGYSGNQSSNYGNRRDQGGTFASRGDQDDIYGNRSGQGGNYGSRSVQGGNFGARSGQGSSNYGNQRYSDSWGGRY